MKYFTKELWSAFQSSEECEVASDIWNKNQIEYRKQLELLKETLHSKEYDFFSKGSLHDGNLVSFTVIDENSIKIKDKNDYRVKGKKIKPLNVQIQVLSYQYIYTLNYKQVEGIYVDSPADKELFGGYFKDFGDWGYDELTKGNSGLLCHEILFSTGASIKIEFKSISIGRKNFIKNWRKYNQ